MDDGGDLPPRPESSEGLADPADPLAEEPVPPAGPDGPHEEALRGAHNVWHRLVEDATNVAVRNLTFVELVNSRSVKEVLPALARIHAKLQSLGLPLVRLHCDRARELVSAPIRQWTLDRGIITTLTSGSSYRSNGRVEAEVGNTKRAIKTILTANQCPLECWPLCARHIGERRLRCQLQKLGFPTGPMLRFGSKVYALRKSWQERYTHWRDAREEVQIMGPDKFTSLTTTSYYVKSLKTGRFFYTDDVVQIPPDAPLELPGASNEIYVEERGEQSSMPQWPGVPTRRLRGKTAVPAIRSMVNIEGEAWGLNTNDPTKDAVLTGIPNQVFQIPEYLKSHLEGDEIGSSGESSWTLGTDSEQTTASPTASTPTLQSDAEEFGGGEWEEAPNNRDGGSSPVASTTSGVAAIRACHANVVDYIRDEMNRLDATTEDQALWIGAITEAISLRALLENQLQQFQHQAIKEDHEKLDQEFLVTRTISNAEVWSHLEDWKPSICAEYEQLLHKKQAVKQITRSQLQDLAKQRGLPIELLPGKMVHTRKAGSGAFRSRAVVCGNYQDPGNEEVYAGGADGNQIRAQIRIASSKSWSIYGTDIRVAFLNAPRRDETKITAMEVPTVFRKLGLATQNDVWVIEKALYGLVGSPRDWCLYRDETLPTVAWTRMRHGREVKGSFKETADENVWRLIEVDVESGESHWSGIMTVYVDDLLVSAEDDAAQAALASIAKIWATSDIEKVQEEGKPLKYCGFEIEVGPKGDGFLISQRMYEKEMVQKWGIEKEIDAPHFKPSGEDENPGEPVQATDIKVAQGMAGALLWLTTRTRPDLAMSVSTVCRLATKNPRRSIEIATLVMQYVKAHPGGLHYTKNVPTDQFGTRGQLKVARHQGLLEVFSDIAFGAGTRNRSVQGLAIYYGGCVIAWQTTVQPFVTHSTAESELVAYCDALNAGRSAEAMLATMMGEASGTECIQRILYGDNVAAIGLAHGTSCSSWRTRHLKIRASYLREALEGTAPGGAWKLLHLKGTELVADGLTKPLHGQAFQAFVADLGMRGPKLESSDGGGNEREVAIATLMAGGLLLSGMDSMEEDNEAGSDTLWVCGALLMALGTIYVGQLTFQGLRCCLKRLSALSQPKLDSRWPLCEECESDGERSPCMTSSSGLRVEQAASPCMTSSSGLRVEQAASPCMTSSSGLRVGRATSSGRMTSSSGLHAERAVSSGCMTSSSGLQSSAERGNSGSISKGMTSSSGSHGECFAAGSQTTLRSTSARSGLKQRGGSSITEQRGASSAAGFGAATSTSTASGSASVSEVQRSPKEKDLSNPWNKFQHENRGKGLSKATLAKIYQYEKAKHNKDN